MDKKSAQDDLFFGRQGGVDERIKELEEEIILLKEEIKESNDMIEALQAACAGRLG